MEEQESEYLQLIRKRYEYDGEMSYEDEGNLLYLLNMPEELGIEEELLAYAQANKDISAKELVVYLNTLVPMGYDCTHKESYDDDEDDV